jgi:hypothetical protein
MTVAKSDNLLKGTYIKENASININESERSVLCAKDVLFISLVLPKMPINRTEMASKTITIIENILYS